MKAPRVVHRAVGAGLIVFGEVTREARHKRETDGDANQAEGKLIKPVRVVKHGARAFVRPGEHLRDQRVDLQRAAGDGARDSDGQHALHALAHDRKTNTQVDAELASAPREQDALEHAGDGDSGGCRQRRGIAGGDQQ